MSEKQLDFKDYPIRTLRPTPSNYCIETSAESADRINRTSRHHYRVTILEHIKGSGGSTCDEVEVALSLRHQTASCFIRFLTQDGFLADSGEKRVTRAGRKAIVWVPAREIKNDPV